MDFRLAMGLCVIIVGATSLMSCQPPTPRIARVEASSYVVVTTDDAAVKTVLAAFDPAEQVIQVRDLDDLLTNFSTPDHQDELRHSAITQGPRASHFITWLDVLGLF